MLFDLTLSSIRNSCQALTHHHRRLTSITSTVHRVSLRQQQQPTDIPCFSKNVSTKTQSPVVWPAIFWGNPSKRKMCGPSIRTPACETAATKTKQRPLNPRSSKVCRNRANAQIAMCLTFANTSLRSSTCWHGRQGGARPIMGLDRRSSLN